MNMTPLPQTLVLPSAAADAREWNDARIDPKIIVRPPHKATSAKPARDFVARNEYPNAQLLFIQSPAGKSQMIPAEWPKMKIENIPTQWPNAKILQIDNGKAATVPLPAK